MFVFDETIIGDQDYQQLCLGERRKSGGGSPTVYKKRGSVAGSFIPISKCDGTTPFRVFIARDVRGKKRGSSGGKFEPIVIAKETTDLYRLYLTSPTGYVTIPLFEIIMQHFCKWWSKHHHRLRKK